jgi:hypothetical protein
VVAAGGEDRIWEVRSPADLGPVWAARSASPADGARAVRAADRVRRGLGWSGGAVLALSHPWFAAGTMRPGRVAAVFARPAGCRGSAARGWADRHTEVNANDPAAAAAAAVQLLTTPW